ncbi:MAG: TIGR02453 family protein [Hyphomicrobiales bacterium]|nr:TIGR02453 family protein [Hyphomicrobiales bacterium]
MTFQGFGSEALPFFKALAFHQSKDWFEANREVYENAVKAPMGDLVEETAARLARAKIPLKGDRKSSLFRIHRDARFSRNKDPYKTNAGAVLTRTGDKSAPGVLYFHLSPEECFFGAGFHAPAPPELARLRAAAPRAPKAFKRMTAKLARTGLELAKEGALKRRPRGFEDIDDPEIELATRLTRFVCLRPAPRPRIHEPSLVDDFCAFASDSLPLLEWGWDAIADSR